jgi:hypothetical protein
MPTNAKLTITPDLVLFDLDLGLWNAEYKGKDILDIQLQGIARDWSDKKQASFVSQVAELLNAELEKND